MDIVAIKDALRTRFASERDAIRFRDAYSNAITARICSLPLYIQARVVHCYLPIRSEVDTRNIMKHALKQGKTVIVPVVDPNTGALLHSRITSIEPHSLQKGKFGILQPRLLDLVDPEACDVMIVPLLAFDHKGYRLGYGKGYYDQLLKQLSAYSIGVAFSAQQMGTRWYDEKSRSERITPELLPHAPHDHPLNMVVTESAILRFGCVQGAQERPESTSMSIS